MQRPNLKRPAPDSAKLQQQQQEQPQPDFPTQSQPLQQQNYTFEANELNQQSWNPTSAFFDPAEFATKLRGELGADASSHQLIRRDPHQQLTIMEPHHDDDYSDDEIINKRAKDAKAAKSNMPRTRNKPPRVLPFIQGLQSFLDNAENEKYIHWSPDGKSIIIPDEKAFAGGLLPQVFKHQRFSSFVRQLNKYGFHKIVGLEDNSMKAAESNKVVPQRYENPYFRRGRPNWVWLIEKTEAKKLPGEKKTKDDVDDEDDDDDADDISDGNLKGLIALPRKEWDDMNRTNAGLQKQIDQLSASSDLHQRSLNNIYGFLAQVFSQQIQQSGGAKNFAALFNAMHQGVAMNSHNNHSSSSVGDMPSAPNIQEIVRNPHGRNRGTKPFLALLAPDPQSSFNPTFLQSDSPPVNFSPNGNVGAHPSDLMSLINEQQTLDLNNYSLNPPFSHSAQPKTFPSSSAAETETQAPSLDFSLIPSLSPKTQALVDLTNTKMSPFKSPYPTDHAIDPAMNSGEVQDPTNKSNHPNDPFGTLNEDNSSSMWDYLDPVNFDISDIEINPLYSGDFHPNAFVLPFNELQHPSNGQNGSAYRENKVSSRDASPARKTKLDERLMVDGNSLPTEERQTINGDKLPNEEVEGTNGSSLQDGFQPRKKIKT